MLTCAVPTQKVQGFVTYTQSGTSAGFPFGRYTLLRPIGRGGMAEVWKAKIHGAQNFQRLVVVKRILPHLASDPEFVRMFTLEAMLSARLNHPNIVQVFEFAEVEGERYLAMEYVHGVNVGDLLKRLKDVRMPVGMAAQIVREVSLALAYAHALSDEDGRPLSLIHRDISPSNVMIGYDGSVKLVDFGVAKALTQSDERTRTGALKGKVAYMSPEAVDGEVELDARTDVFAAGVVLYELLTGRRLFKGHDDLRTIALVRACKVDPPSKERPEIPPELDAIVAKALARNREERYQTADHLAADLTKVAHEHVWDSFRTAAFLKQHDIQPGSEPELRAQTPGVALAPPSAESSPETRRVTVVERKGGRSSTSLPVVTTGRPRLTWALVGAGGALALAAGVFLGVRLWHAPLPPTATVVPAPVVRPVDPPRRAVEPPVTLPPAPPLQTAPTAALPEAPAVATAPAAAIRPPVDQKPATAASSKARRRKQARMLRSGASPSTPASTSARQSSSRTGGPAASGKSPQSKQPAAPAAPTPPAIDLKRGDVINTF